MHKILTTLFVLANLVTFSQSQEGYRQGENDMYFKFFTKNEGKTAVIGDVVSLHMIMKSADGTELKNSYKEKGGKPVLFPVKIPQFPGDIYEAVSMMAVGDSANFLIHADSMYHKVFRSPMPSSVKKGSYLLFTIKTQWIKAQKDLEIKEHAVDVDRGLLAKQEAALLKYAKDNDLGEGDKISGVYLYTLKEGYKKPAKAKQMISFNYTGSFLDGKVFETTIQQNGIGHPMSVTVGNQQVIRGWEAVFTHMKVGGVYKVLIPSHMAFGPKGRGGIVPADTPLIFDIEIVSVK